MPILKDKKRKHLISIKYYVPSIVFLCIIFYFSSQAGSESHSSSNFVIIWFDNLGINLTGIFGENIATTIVRKGGHIIEYIILYLLTLWGLKLRECKRPLIKGLMLVFLFACFDEMHQRFVPGREGKFLDVLIDMSGIVTLIFVKKFYNYINKILRRA